MSKISQIMNGKLFFYNRQNLLNMNLASKQSKQLNNCRYESEGSEDDFQKLMDICNSYGLNEEQTNQLIDQFKKGALFSPDQSFSDSLNQSQAQVTELEKHCEEEYSFKHQKMSFQERSIHHQEKQRSQQVQNTQRAAQKSNRSQREEQNFSFQLLEKMLTEKFTIQKELVKNLQDENNRLRNESQQKQKQMNRLTQIKCQDTQIILGLKDIISNLTIALKEKQSSYKELQDKYNNLMETRVRELSSKRSLTEFSETEFQDVTNIYQNSMRDSSCNKRSTKNLKEYKEQPKQNRHQYPYDKKRAGNRIDVKKYKQMIQNLRNNCG